MNILVTGANGQLGNELRKLSVNSSGHQFYFTDIADLDITNKQAIDAYFTQYKIQIVINCAAYTAVDKAEDDESTAILINATAVAYLAQASTAHHAVLIHISTDYVYDGCGYKPYQEDHELSPVSAYGRTKLAGEKAAQTCPQSVVIRTSWLYSAYGNNFVKTMLRLGKERDSLNVIFDQVGTPTYAADLAEAILVIAGKVGQEAFKPGIFHYSNEGVCSWYDFAHEIMSLSDLTCKVQPIETKDYPTPATRPHYSVLNKALIKAVYHIEIPHWRDSLEKCLKVLKD